MERLLIMSFSFRGIGRHEAGVGRVSDGSVRGSEM